MNAKLVHYAQSTLWLLIVALAIVLLGAWLDRAHAQQPTPRAESGAECTAFADMAIVARALAAGRVEQGQSAQIMSTIYSVTEPRHALMMAAIIRAAFTDPTARTPGEFATAFLMACAEGRGNVDGFLGVRL